MVSDTETQSDGDKFKTKDSLKRQRSAFKGQLTQFRNKLTTIETIGSIESNIRRLQILYDKYQNIQLKLELVDESASTDRVSFEEDYEYVESNLLDKLHKLKRLENTTKEPLIFESSSNSTQIEQAIPSISIKLPELKLPTFSGAESDWLAFKDVFVDIIHRKPNIENTVKFVYLKTHLRAGKAFNLIDSLPVTADNYETAWKILCDRYVNDLLIQKAHMKELYNIKTPVENSSNSLQSFIDQSVKNFNALKSLNVRIDSWDLMLIHHLTERLDTSSKLHVIKNSEANKLLTFDKLMMLLRNRVRILEAIKGAASSLKTSTINKSHSFSKSKVSSLVLNLAPCLYCRGSHSIPNCPEFTDSKLTPQMRFQFIRNHRLCTNCLIDTHTVLDCDKPPCNICSQKHHSLLHFGKTIYFKGRRQIPSNSSPSSSTPVTQDDPVSNSSQVSGTSSFRFDQCSIKKSSASSGVSQILIGTALVNVTSDSNKQLLCRAMLDSGSQLNFVTENIVNLMKVKPQRTSKIVSGIGGKETEIKTKVSLTISSRVSDFSTTLEFYVIPKITNYLPASPLNINFKLTPAKIQLADPYFNVPNEIDILIGAEIYNELFTGRTSITLFKNLPAFYDSVFGYVISGKASISNVTQPQLSTALCTFEALHNDIKRFWELETVSVENNYSLDEKY